MISSLNASVDNIYEIMNSPSAAISNTDTNKSATIGSDIQKNIKEVLAQSQKGGTDNFRQSLYKLDVKA